VRLRLFCVRLWCAECVWQAQHQFQLALARDMHAPLVDARHMNVEKLSDFRHRTEMFENAAFGDHGVNYSMLEASRQACRKVSSPQSGMTINERLKRRREKLGLSVADMAKYCGVKGSAVYGWEDGATKSLRSPNLVRAAEFLRTTEKWLALGEGPEDKIIHADELSPVETELIYDFRDLNTDEQTGMKSAISSLAEQHRKKRRKK
jgi:transcriptional regulator with XRE-family HTH domain